ncbi:MAG: hypothetical protein LBP28_05650 [Coriobacteriales bacterium]|jgi:hypothetical protein|nr:hypothetical protein [Coriobacteriales bacterium]
MLSAEEYDWYLMQCDTIVNEANGHLSRWLASDEFVALYTKDPEAAARATIKVVMSFTDVYGGMMSELAAQFFDYCQESELGRLINPASPASPVSHEQVARNVQWAFSEPDSDFAGYRLEDRLKIIGNKLTGSQARMIKQPARGTIIDSAGKARVRYARVPRGAKTCKFCLMLASRGFVYASKATAGEMNRFHDHCDCMIVPGFGIDPQWPGYDPDELYEQYKAGTLGEAAGVPTGEQDGHKREPIKIPKVGPGAKSVNYTVDLRDGRKVPLYPGAELRTTRPNYAGKGSTRKIEDSILDDLIKKYGGNREEWRKVFGNGILKVSGKRRYAEVHWYEMDDEIPRDLYKKRWNTKKDYDNS